MKREKKTFDCAMDRRWRWSAWNICNVDVSCCCCCCCCRGRYCAVGTRMKPRCYTNTTQLTRIHIAWEMVMSAKNNFRIKRPQIFHFFRSMNRIWILWEFNHVKKVCLCFFFLSNEFFLSNPNQMTLRALKTTTRN